MKSTVWAVLGLTALLAEPASAGDLTQVAEARHGRAQPAMILPDVEQENACRRRRPARGYQHNQSDLEFRRGRSGVPLLGTRRPARVQSYNPKEVGVDRSVPWQ